MPSSTSSPVVPGKNATAIAAAAKKARIAAQLRAQHNSQNAVKYYAAGVLGLILLFTIFHWSRFLYSRYASKGLRKSGIMKAQVSIARMVRHVLTHRVPGFTSIGHAVLVLAYIGINVSLTVTNIDWSSMMPISKRMGWMAITNAAFVTFLALKNTPLAFLTAYSYERLNILHQVGGYSTIAFALMHTIMMCVAFDKIHFTKMLLAEPQIYGITAVVALVIAMCFAVVIRRIRYEVFYISHIAMFIVFVINVALHQPEMHHKVIIITIVTGAIWGSDRILRLCRLGWYMYDNKATITPLPHGGTRIVLRRSPSRAVPGTHCFLWIPKIRAFETHPFTIVSNTPTSLELVVSAYDGFTNDLHEYATKHPGVSLRASFDGPYGALPNFSKVADKVILVAGGSGASFTFGVALDMIRKLGDTAKPTIEFIWSVREQDQLSWFHKELTELQASHRVNITLHSTRPSYTGSPIVPLSPIEPNSPNSPIGPEDDEKNLVGQNSNATLRSNATDATLRPDYYATFPADIEKMGKEPDTRPWDSSSSVHVLPGRPDVDVLIREIISKAGDEERIAIAACGPDGLMWAVRRTAASCIKVKGPSIELHCEQFGW